MCTKSQAMEIVASVFHDSNRIYHGQIRDAILYGSYVRGEHTEHSDIDILLLADLTQEEISAQNRAIAGISSRLCLENDVTVSVQIVPCSQFRRYAPFLPFYQNILKEGVHYASFCLCT